MFKFLISMTLLMKTILLTGEENFSQIIDFGELQPSCDFQNTNWKTGQLAFNCAPEVGTFLTYLKKNYQIDTAVETGTFMGNTTVFLSLLFTDVYTIEIAEQVFKTTSAKLKEFSNVQCFLGSSDRVFLNILPKLKEKRTLFYLDAHWENHWPLKQELKEISKTHHNNCVIVIDDFKVPGRKDIPYDKYKENECSLDYIKEELKLIFSDYEVHYIIPSNPLCRAKFVAWPKNWL